MTTAADRPDAGVSERPPAATGAPAALTESEGPEKVEWRRIAGLFRPESASIALLLVMVVLQALASAASPFFLRALLDDALPHRNLTLLTEMAAGMIGSVIAAGVLSVFAGRVSAVVGQRVMNQLRLSIFVHLQRMSLGFFTRTRTGDVMSRLLNDVGGINYVLTGTVASAIQNGTVALAVLGGLLVMDWRLSLLALVVVPPFLAVTIGLGRERRKLVRGRQRKMAALTALAQESLSFSGILMAKSMGLQDEIRNRFARNSAEISQLDIHSTLVGRWRTSSRRMSLTALPAVLYWLAGYELIAGWHNPSLGTIVAFTSMVNRLVSPISSMQGIGQNLSSSASLFARIFEVIDLPVDVADRPGARALGVTRGEVEVRDVCFRYPGSDAQTLDHVGFTVRPGTVTAIVGESGSGKTTLGYLLLRLYEPQHGAVLIDGVDLRDVRLDSLPAAIGLIPQDSYLLHSTVRENLQLARPGATAEEIEEACRQARIHELIQQLPDGYDTIVGERGHRFSGGERQRIAIARMLLRLPPILVLDEATSALDSRTERAVQEALDAVARERTTIIIAHRLSTIMRADQILVLDKGRIVESGTHSELLGRGDWYAKLVAAAPVGRA